MGTGFRRRILEFVASLTLSIFVIALYDLYQDDRSRQQELALDQEGPAFLSAAEEYLAEGRRGEEKLLSIVESPTIAPPLKFRAAAVLASGAGERGKTIREVLARPGGAILAPEEEVALRALFEGPMAAALEADLDPVGAPGRLLVDSIARRVASGQGGIAVRVTAPDAHGGRRISLSPGARSPVAESQAANSPPLFLNPPPSTAGR